MRATVQKPPGNEEFVLEQTSKTRKPSVKPTKIERVKTQIN